VNNVINRPNFSAFSGIQTSPFFLAVTSVQNPRKVDLGVTLRFERRLRHTRQLASQRRPDARNKGGVIPRMMPSGGVDSLRSLPTLK
jgi:hypothetical protein